MKTLGSHKTLSVHMYLTNLYHRVAHGKQRLPDLRTDLLDLEAVCITNAPFCFCYFTDCETCCCCLYVVITVVALIATQYRSKRTPYSTVSILDVTSSFSVLESTH